jgi:hypothetical protein
VAERIFVVYNKNVVGHSASLRDLTGFRVAYLSGLMLAAG